MEYNLFCHATACSPSFKWIAMELNSLWPWPPPSWCLALHGFVLSLFLLPCIMKMRSSCEPWGSQMGLWMSLPLLTTNSLSGCGQFPLCCYNLFGFQVPHGIKNNLLSRGVWVAFAFRQSCSVSLCPWGTPSLVKSHSPGQEKLCAWQTETAGCVWAWKRFHLISHTFQEIFSKYVLSTHDVPGGRDAMAIR